MRIQWKKIRQNIPNRVYDPFTKESYEVLWIEGFHTDRNNTITYGETRPNTKQIVLNSKQNDKDAVLTFFHEIKHFLNFTYDLGITESKVQKFENTFMFMYMLMLTLDGKYPRKK